MSTRLTHGSLFSGIGGPEVAAEMMGWENVFHCDINPFGRKVLDYWYPNSKSYEDITKTDFTEWRGKIDVLTGGFPCQPFSVAGKRKGADDNRYLWPHMLRAIREIRPAWVVGENVAGILTMVQPGKEVEVGCQASLFGEDNRKRILLRQEYVVETICKDLEREGYSVQPLLIPACAVGAPHRRDRVWFVAHANSNGGQEKTERKFKQAEKNNEQSESLFHSGTFSYRSDARAEDVRQERENTILSDGTAPNSDSYRQRFREDEQKLDTRSERKTNNSTGCKNGSSPIAGSERCCGRCDNWEERPFYYDGERSFEKSQSERDKRERRIGEDGSVDADSDSKRLQAFRVSQCYDAEKRKIERRCPMQHTCNDRGTLFTEWWQDFPTQSPVCGRDDGLPFNVGDLTIPFTRWRQEAVKAYGNAIVPQVMYEIFRAIGYIENEYYV